MSGPPSDPSIPPPLREVIARYGLSARRPLGQHFLLDSNLCDRIARIAGDATGRHVIEVGPGPGGLTRALLKTSCEQVFAVEKDHRCVAALQELVRIFGPRLVVREADALTLDLAALVSAPRRIVANLPYNIATPLLIAWLRQIDAYESLTLMFQSEVADRLVASPRNRAYGRLSVITQWLCTVRRAFSVDKRAFTPPPKISSSVVFLVPREAPLAPASWSALETVTAAAFGQRRKMLKTSLKVLDLDPGRFGIDPSRRPEELDVEAFCALARGYDSLR